jgi:hypothetical protein
MHNYRFCLPAVKLKVQHNRCGQTQRASQKMGLHGLLDADFCTDEAEQMLVREHGTIM